MGHMTTTDELNLTHFLSAYYIELFVPPTDFYQTKHIRLCPRCVEGACALGRGLAQPQAEQFAKAAGYHGQPIFWAFSVTRKG